MKTIWRVAGRWWPYQGNSDSVILCLMPRGPMLPVHVVPAAPGLHAEQGLIVASPLLSPSCSVVFLSRKLHEWLASLRTVTKLYQAGVTDTLLSPWEHAVKTIWWICGRLTKRILKSQTNTDVVFTCSIQPGSRISEPKERSRAERSTKCVYQQSENTWPTLTHPNWIFNNKIYSKRIEASFSSFDIRFLSFIERAYRTVVKDSDSGTKCIWVQILPPWTMLYSNQMGQ